MNPISTGVNARVFLILPIPIHPRTKANYPKLDDSERVSTMFPPDPCQSTYLTCEEHSYGVFPFTGPSFNSGSLTTICSGPEPGL